MIRDNKRSRLYSTDTKWLSPPQHQPTVASLFFQLRLSLFLPRGLITSILLGFQKSCVGLFGTFQFLPALV
ncbi:hypothetical protein PC116_g11289 [Phytophthora cactorum]|uniref:Uncharacterized protein n=1 Tax=Phytophthora cactorum TaxID=29920 RepID=A0A8T0ZHA8_9STRA|nr:hypothetical protein PC112_g11534 [Phytophthora cactorum]KAG2861793.1 hypothetical protein PC113_g6866 [Phytophthora cactorum]KAG2902628.1 hypothetical protein PC114_g12659 [Phytophthora cactorum]KAG2916893.1 hypothetical protein PC115_g10898 [Phytophthora cactorum]KAG2947341.1 hypothetical protein PC117_g6902 [Phytophthora cactorum]